MNLPSSFAYDASATGGVAEVVGLPATAPPAAATPLLQFSPELQKRLAAQVMQQQQQMWQQQMRQQLMWQQQQGYGGMQAWTDTVGHGVHSMHGMYGMPQQMRGSPMQLLYGSPHVQMGAPQMCAQWQMAMPLQIQHQYPPHQYPPQQQPQQPQQPPQPQQPQPQQPQQQPRQQQPQQQPPLQQPQQQQQQTFSTLWCGCSANPSRDP
jgi:hypothetical protein